MIYLSFPVQQPHHKILWFHFAKYLKANLQFDSEKTSFFLSFFNDDK